MASQLPILGPGRSLGLPWWAPVLLLGLVACSGRDTFRPDTDDTDPSAVGDDDDDDDSGPSEPPGELGDCDVPYDTPAPGGEGSGSCITELIECGEVVRGNNAGGTTVYGSEVGQPFSQCAGSASETSTLSGIERVYELNYPPNTRYLHVELDSCERSWLFWHQEADLACPTSLVTCGYAPYGDYYAQWADVALANNGRIFFVVEGDANDGGNFELRVDCFE